MPEFNTKSVRVSFLVDRFFSEYVAFLLSVSFQQCSLLFSSACSYQTGKGIRYGKLPNSLDFLEIVMHLEGNVLSKFFKKTQIKFRGSDNV